MFEGARHTRRMIERTFHITTIGGYRCRRRAIRSAESNPCYFPPKAAHTETKLECLEWQLLSPAVGTVAWHRFGVLNQVNLPHTPVRDRPCMTTYAGLPGNMSM